MVPQIRSKTNTMGMTANLRSALFITSRAFGVRKSPPGMNPNVTLGQGKVKK